MVIREPSRGSLRRQSCKLHAKRERRGRGIGDPAASGRRLSRRKQVPRRSLSWTFRCRVHPGTVTGSGGAGIGEPRTKLGRVRACNPEDVAARVLAASRPPRREALRAKAPSRHGRRPAAAVPNPSLDPLALESPPYLCLVNHQDAREASILRGRLRPFSRCALIRRGGWREPKLQGRSDCKGI